ncbi:MAG: hypothetical protein AAB671_02065, partial [Patescibacteria group bacterium]
KHFDREYTKLPAPIRKQVDKQLVLLVLDLQYPSLRAKKYDESRGIWQARITDDYRLYFQIIEDTYYLLTVVKHPK